MDRAPAATPEALEAAAREAEAQGRNALAARLWERAALLRAARAA